MAVAARESHFVMQRVGALVAVMEIRPTHYWLSAADYPAAQELCSDLPATFDQWLAVTEAAIKREATEGIVKIAINPGLYAAWCRANGFGFNTETLSKYAVAEARRRAAG